MKNKTVRIGPINFEIFKVSEVTHPDGNHLDAGIYYRKSQIRIRGDLSKQKTFEIFIHECLHGLLDTGKIELGDDIEEETVTTLAPLVASFLKDNWKLLQRMGDLK